MDYTKLFISILTALVYLHQLILAENTLSANQTLADGDILTSPNQVFQLGFFPSDTTKPKYLGIWFKATPDIVVWTANRQNPIVRSKGVLTLHRNGTIALTTSEVDLIVFSSSSVTVSDPVLQLLNTGNLVLVDSNSKGGESSIWQSFDYPGEHRIPGMKMGLNTTLTSWKNADDPSPGAFTYRIVNEGFAQMMVFNGKTKIYRSGQWNGSFFTGLQAFPDPSWQLQTRFKDGKLISIFDPYVESYNTRITMNYTGYVQRVIMNEHKDAWNIIFGMPADPCDYYGKCGPNGICYADRRPECECLPGFVQKNVKEWRIFDSKSGCIRPTTYDCEKNVDFLKVESVKFPDPVEFRLEPKMNSDECRNECLKRCNCTAFADMHVSNASGGCLMWYGDLNDIREFTGEFSPDSSIHLRVPKSELDKRILENKKKGKRKEHKKVIIIATASAFGSLFLALTCGCILWRLNHNRLKALKRKREDIELPVYDLGTIATATNNFSGENLLGEGGFGPVYKGSLSTKQVIAVKRMSESSGQGTEEFKTEVTLIAKLQHRNLVRLLGCCIKGKEKLLIYEYMENKSLDYFIFDRNRSALLTWPKRFDIIMGVARGLVYLHHDSRLKIIHRDLKTSNILLDGDLNAKISDFGLARMFKVDQFAAITKRVIGTYGYMAPEYAFDGKFSIKSDVFSMGVVILEIVSGKKNKGYQNLLKQAWLLWKENREIELMDPCYNTSSCNMSQVERCIKVGLLCVQNDPDDRPIMSSVVLMLSTDDTTLPLPKRPAFFLESSCNRKEQDATQSNEFSRCEITVTDVEAR